MKSLLSCSLGMTALLLVTPLALAQPAPPPSDFETWLLPVVEEARPGAFGTLWATTEWLAFSAKDEFEGVEVGPFNVCESLCGPVQEIRGGPPAEPPIASSEPTDPPGHLFWVTRAKADRVWLKIRVQDLANTTPKRVGVEIPVVRERNFHHGGSLLLLNIPLDGQFRQWLRLYDIDRKSGVTFRIVGRRQVTGELLFDTTVGTTVLAEKWWTPGAGSVDLRALLPVEAAKTAYLEITPNDSTIRYWGFATITSNETQEIVTVTP